MEKEELKQLVDIEYKIIEDKKKIFSITIIISSILLFILIGVAISLFLTRVSIIYIVLYMVFAVPITLILIGLIIFKSIRNYKKAQQDLFNKIPTKKLRVLMFMPDRKIKIFSVITLKDYFVFENGEYFINEKCIWKDFLGMNLIFYFYGIPNPIMFNFRANIQKYLDYFQKKVLGLNPEKVVVDGYEIEVAYNSENIKLLRQDNFINQLHGAINMSLKDILIYVFLFIIFIVQLIVLFKPNPAPVVQTETVKQVLIIISLMRLRNERKN